MDVENRHLNQDSVMTDVSIADAQTEQPLTLAHLPDICLEKILTYLEIDDLTHAADAKNGLTNSAIHVFKTKFKDEKIEYSLDKNELFSKQLKYFGPFISRMSIWGMKSSETDIAKIFDSMLESCGPTLSKLTIHDVDYKFQLRHRFLLVSKLTFYISKKNALNKSWTELNQYFPSLRTLKFKDSFGTSALNPLFRTHYPSVQKILFSEMKKHPTNFLTMAQILNSNPQITSLKISFDSLHFEVDITDFQSNVNWFSLNVTKLDIEGVRISPKYVAQLRHLQSLSFETTSYQTTKVPLKQPIIELTVSSPYTALKDKIIDFIVGFPNLRKLTIKTDELIQLSHMNRIARESSELAEVIVLMKEEVFLPSMRMAAGILELIRKCTSLRSLKFECECMIDYNQDVVDDKYKQHAELQKEFQRNIDGIAKSIQWLLTSKSCKWKYSDEFYIFTYHFVSDK